MLTLSGQLAYGGATVVSQGTLAFNSATAPGLGDIEIGVSDSGTMNIQNGASIASSGVTYLGHAWGVSGNINQSGGSFAITGFDSSAGSRALAIGEWPSETSTYNISGGSLTVPNGITYVPWNGTAAFNISGGMAQLMEISAGNTDGYTGNLNVSGTGALYVGSGGIVAAGSSSENITLSGGTLGAYASWASSLPMNLAGPATIDTGGNTITLSGALSGGGCLTKVGAGNLVLGAANVYSGGTMVNSGTLTAAFWGSNAGGTLPPGQPVTINSGATLQLASGDALGWGSGSVSMVNLNGGVLTTSNSTFHDTLPDLNLTAGTITAAGGDASGLNYLLDGNVTTNASAAASAILAPAQIVLRASGTGNITFDVARGSGAVDLFVSASLVATTVYSSTASLIKSGDGIMMLSGSNTYAGATIINGGVLTVGASNTLSPHSDLAVNGGTLDVTGFPQAVKSLTIGAAGSLNLTAGNLLISSSPASFNGTLNVLAAAGGSAELIGYPSYSGSFSTVGVPPGYRLQYNSTQLDLMFTGCPSWCACGGGNWSGGANWSNGSPPNGAGQTALLNQATSAAITVALDMPATVGTLQFGNSGGDLTVGYTLSGSNALTLDNSGSPSLISASEGTHGISSPLILADDLQVAPAAGATIVIDGNIGETSPSSLILSGPGMLVLGGSNSYSGGTVVEEGTLCVTSSAALSDAGGSGASLTIGAGGVLDFDPSMAAAAVEGLWPARQAAIAAAVPEPGGLGLLALGASAAVLAVARRKAALLRQEG